MTRAGSSWVAVCTSAGSSARVRKKGEVGNGLVTPRTPSGRVSSIVSRPAGSTPARPVPTR